MAAREELIILFDEMATALELLGANAFKVNANRKVARVLEDMPEDLPPLADDPAAIQKFDGIGKSSAVKICEFLTTGHIQDHQALLEQLPDGLLELLNVPGLGPKTIRNLWEHAGVESIADLEQAIADDALGDVPRLGKKTIANIADSIEFMKKAGERMPIGRALP